MPSASAGSLGDPAVRGLGPQRPIAAAVGEACAPADSAAVNLLALNPAVVVFGAKGHRPGIDEYGKFWRNTYVRPSSEPQDSGLTFMGFGHAVDTDFRAGLLPEAGESCRRKKVKKLSKKHSRHQQMQELRSWQRPKPATRMHCL